MRIDVRPCRYARLDTSGKAAGDLIDRMATYATKTPFERPTHKTFTYLIIDMAMTSRCKSQLRLGVCLKPQRHAGRADVLSIRKTRGCRTVRLTILGNLCIHVTLLHFDSHFSMLEQKCIASTETVRTSEIAARMLRVEGMLTLLPRSKATIPPHLPTRKVCRPCTITVQERLLGMLHAYTD
jgi:hypothetical protein